MQKTPILIVKSIDINPATALPVDHILFIVPPGAEYDLVAASEAHTVVGSDAGAVTVDIKKHSAGTAPSAGTSMLSSTFNLKSTANTPVNKVRESGLSATASSRRVTGGQMISADFTGTLTALAGCNLTLSLVEVRPPTYR